MSDILILPPYDTFPSIALFKGEDNLWYVPVTWTLLQHLRSTAQKKVLNVSSKYILHAITRPDIISLMQSRTDLILNIYGKRSSYIKKTMKFCTIQTYLSCLRNARIEDIWATSTSALDISDYTRKVFSIINKYPNDDKGKEEEPVLAEPPQSAPKRKRVPEEPISKKHLVDLLEAVRGIVAEEIKRSKSAEYEATLKEKAKNKLKGQFENLFN